MEYHKIETLYERNEKTFKVNPNSIKNRTYSLIKSWLWTEKIDGTNIRCIWQDGKLTFGGKTDNAQIHADLIKHLYELLPVARLQEHFPESSVVIYGEGYGAGIQKGGDYSPTKKFIVFDVLIDGKWWMNWENTCDIASKLGLEVVPFLGEMTIQEATNYVMVGLPSGARHRLASAAGRVRKVKLQVQFNANKIEDDGVVSPNLMFTPPINEDYWLMRVPLSETQAVVCFPKFFTIGIGFQKERDWNTNLPWSEDAESIFRHIRHNKGNKSIKDADCIEAIRMLQAEIERRGGYVK